MRIFLLILASLIGMFFIWMIIQSNKEGNLKKKSHEEFLKIFANKNIKTPRYEQDFRTAPNNFRIVFYSRSDFEFAQKNGLFKLFKDKITALNDSDYDANASIFFDHE